MLISKAKIPLLFLAAIIIAMLLFSFSAVKVHAGGDVDLNGILELQYSDGSSKVLAAGDTIKAGQTVFVRMSSLDAKYGEPISPLYNSKKVSAHWSIGSDKSGYRRIDAVLKNGRFTYTTYNSDQGKSIYFYTSSTDSHYNNNTPPHMIPGSWISYSLDIKTGNLKVTGITNESGYKFDMLMVDGSVEDSSINEEYFVREINTKKLKIGWHGLKATIKKGSSTKEVKHGTGFPAYIYARPTISANQFVTYNNYFVFKNRSVTSDYDGLVLSYRPRGGKNWINGDPTKSSGWFSSYETGKMSGLKANTFYEVRASYTKNADGRTFSPLVWGLDSAYSNTITIKTGPAKKPPIKSIKISKAKIKTSRTKGKWYWDNGHLKYLKSYKVYRTTFTVTVTMKKKPGVKGIYIGEKKVKGNKKKYKAKFTVDGKMKGKKVRVDVRTYGNDIYGQRSLVYTKKVKVKK